MDYSASQTLRTQPTYDARSQSTVNTGGSLGGEALTTPQTSVMSTPYTVNETQPTLSPAPTTTGTTMPYQLPEMANDPNMAPINPPIATDPVQLPANAPMGPATAQYQTGVLASPETSPAIPGWTYGANPTENQIQGQVAPGMTDTSKVDWQGVPVTQIQQGQPYLQQAIDAYYQQAQSRLDPQMQQQQQRLETQLQNMGLTRGSAAWNAEMDRQMRASNDAYSTARNQAIMAGGQEAARMQGMDIAAGTFANQAAQQNFGNSLQSQAAQNQAFQQLFQQAMDSGKFANAAEAQEFAQNQVQAMIRNQAMGAQGGLEEQRLSREQQGSQFQQDLGLRTQAQQIQAQQWATDYGLRDRTQQAQMSQFAAQLGLSESQLAAQIDQWAAQNGLSREQMANQLLMSREQNQTQLGVAGTQAGATLGAAQAQAGATTAVGQMNAALGQRALENQERQQDFDMYWQSMMNPIAYQNALMAGTVPTDPNFAATPVPAIPGIPQTTTDPNAAASTGTGIGSLAGFLLPF